MTNETEHNSCLHCLIREAVDEYVFRKYPQGKDEEEGMDVDEVLVDLLAHVCHWIATLEDAEDRKASVRECQDFIAAVSEKCRETGRYPGGANWAGH